MNLRWLLGNYVDPQYPMPLREQFRVSVAAHNRHIRPLAFWGYTLAITVPIVLALVMLKRFMRALGIDVDSGSYGITLAVVVAVAWVWSAWMYRWLYVRPIRRALRDTGLDLCVQCGYDLRELPGGSLKCPECGSAREPLAMRKNGLAP